MGRDKRLLKWRGHTLLERVIKLVRQCTGRTPALIGDSISPVMAEDCPLLADAVPKRGPLGGLVAGLGWCQTPWLLVLPVDLPHLGCREIDALLQAARSDLDLVCLGSRQNPQPLAGMYSTRRQTFWRKRLEKGQLAIRDGFSELEILFLPPPSGPEALLNINQPSDLEKLHHTRGGVNL